MVVVHKANAGMSPCQMHGMRHLFKAMHRKYVAVCGLEHLAAVMRAAVC
jgi:hypothetical protein